MAIDYTRALEVPNGVIIESGAGFFSGVAAPDFDCPVGSYYLKTDATQYLKTSAGTGTGTWTIITYGGGGGTTTNLGMGATKIPNGSTWSIDLNYESLITRRCFILGRLIVAGRLSVLF